MFIVKSYTKFIELVFHFLALDRLEYLFSTDCIQMCVSG